MSKHHVLIVEDTQHLRENMVEALRMEGYKVSSAHHGKEALQLLEKVTPAIIVTDLLMPEMNGFEFIEQVRAKGRWNKIPILVFTAVPEQENKERVLEMGANSFLKKPSSLDELLNEVKNLTEDV
jgi:DNA-binding response OmpR family regulator